MKIAALFLVLTSFVISAEAQWVKQSVDTTASFRGLSVVNEEVIWASGTGGTVIRTIDGGKKWDVIQVPDAVKLDFRDIQAFDANTAYILSIGNGESSRIYKTTDGGKTWSVQFKNTNEKAFFDAIACWDKNNCIAMSDPIDNKFVLINTTDGGATWKPMDTKNMPATKDGEAAFAASGTCLITQGKNNAFLVSGGSAARVFKSMDRGKTWSVYDTPITKGTPGSGIFSIAMRDAKNGVIVGGNYEKPTDAPANIAVTRDGGMTWKLYGIVEGYRSGVTFVRDFNSKQAVFAVGTSGWESLRLDPPGGVIMHSTNKGDYNSVAAAGEIAWVVGPKGTVAKIELNRVDISIKE